MAVDMAGSIFSTLTDAFEASMAGAVVRAIRQKDEKEFRN